MEKAFRIDWQNFEASEISESRIYFGHETCEFLLPSPKTAQETALSLMDNGCRLTLVTPFLSSSGIDSVMRLIDSILEISGKLEVVCSDWGLLNSLAEMSEVEPVLGRMLCGQQRDPRIARIVSDHYQNLPARKVHHLDGTTCDLTYQAPSPNLLSHYCRSPLIDKEEVVRYLDQLGVRRAELNNVPQGLEIDQYQGWSYSIYYSKVLLSIMRSCPRRGEKMRHPQKCDQVDCKSRRGPVEWKHPDFPAILTRIDNSIYYENEALPENLSSLPVDRIVYDKFQ